MADDYEPIGILAEREARIRKQMDAARAALDRDLPARPINGTAPDAPERAAIESAGTWLAAFRAPEMLLDPILVQSQVVALVGQPNAGKTTISIQIGLATAGLVHLPGVVANPGRVVYLVGENEVNFALQLAAACEQHGISRAALDGHLYVLPRRFPIVQQIDWLMGELAAIGDVKLVIVDTRRAYAGGEDENDNSDAAFDAAAKRQITRAAGRPAVIDLNHPVKGATGDELLPRGGSAYYGEIDANWCLYKDSDVSTLTHSKLRSAPWNPIRWQLETVVTQFVDAKGTPMKSVIATALSDTQAAAHDAAATERENRLLFAMLHHPRSSMAEWARQCGWCDAAGVPEKWRVQRTLKTLTEDRLARKYRGRWVLTDAGKREAERVED